MALVQLFPTEKKCLCIRTDSYTDTVVTIEFVGSSKIWRGYIRVRPNEKRRKEGRRNSGHCGIEIARLLTHSPTFILSSLPPIDDERSNKLSPECGNSFISYFQRISRWYIFPSSRPTLSLCHPHFVNIIWFHFYCEFAMKIATNIESRLVIFQRRYIYLNRLNSLRFISCETRWNIMK